jgi:hypothetical protein
MRSLKLMTVPKIEMAMPKMMIDLGSISSTFYVQLLHTQIPKVQNNNELTVIFVRLESTLVKAACKTLMRLAPVLHFTPLGTI